MKETQEASPQEQGRVIMDIVRQQRRHRPQTWQDIQERAAFRERVVEKLRRAQEELRREQPIQLTWLQVALLLLAAALSAPAKAVEEAGKTA